MNIKNLNIAYFKNNILVIFLAVIIVLLISTKLWAQTEEEDVIFFDSNTNSISEQSQEILNKRVESLKDLSEYSITLEGYSDITGRADYNLELSKKRAQLVKDYLVDQGVDSSSIDVVAKGGTEKYGAGETNETLEQNRRVNLIVNIPYVPAIEIEPEPTQEPEPTEKPEITQQPIITPEPVTGDTIEEPTSVATPAPAMPISKEVQQKIQAQIRKNASDGINFISPGEMRIGQSYIVEAEVSNAFVEALSKDLPDLNMENQVGLNLVGDSFDIDAEQDDISQLKTVGQDLPAVWEWNVTPNRDGIQSLVLSVVINGQSSANGLVNAEFATFQRVIDVESSIIHSITSSYLIMGVLILLIITVVVWILIRIFRMS